MINFVTTKINKRVTATAALQLADRGVLTSIHELHDFSASTPETPAVGYLNLPRPLLPVVRALLPPGLVQHSRHTVPSLRPFLVDSAGYGDLAGRTSHRHGPVPADAPQRRAT